jgi:DNA-binding CsgD family transcriptional regulator
MSSRFTNDGILKPSEFKRELDLLSINIPFNPKGILTNKESMVVNEWVMGNSIVGIADRLGATRERIRQILLKVQRKMGVDVVPANTWDPDDISSLEEWVEYEGLTDLRSDIKKAMVEFGIPSDAGKDVVNFIFSRFREFLVSRDMERDVED